MLQYLGILKSTIRGVSSGESDPRGRRKSAAGRHARAVQEGLVPMLKYTVKRVVLAVITVFIISAITFFAMNAIPGGPFSKEKAPDPAVQAALEARFNLDKPVGQQFLIYLKNLMHGDFGISLKTGREISQIIGEKFAISARLGGMAAGFAIRLTAGVLSGHFEGILLACAASAMLGLMYMAIQMPVMLRFGIEQGRMWTMLFTVVFAFGAVYASQISLSAIDATRYAALAVPVLVIVMQPVSIRISTALYGKR